MPSTHDHLLWLRTLVADGDWVIGAVNYDEDLHFSTYYLRASLADNLGHDCPGYSHIVGIYEDFTERYYLLKDECIATAASIVHRALEAPDWLPTILDEIRHLSDALASIFPSSLSQSELAEFTDDELSSLYRDHHRRHTDLYRVARIPEALDRGVSWYSTYLRRYLRETGADAELAEEHFAQLTQPATVSVLTQELAEFDGILAKALRVGTLTTVAQAFPRRARLLLPPEVITELNAHWRKWRFLSYHGYGRREPTVFAEYLDRLVRAAGDPSVRRLNIEEITKQLRESAAERDQLCDDLSVDDAHRSLFYLYPEIGAVKLHRRYAQLRNFYYLDMLLAEISRRFGADEWTTRCMLPDEVVDLLESGANPSPAIQLRKKGCVYVLTAGREDVLVGNTVRELRTTLEVKTKPDRDRRVLRGVVASKGRVVGSCKLMLRGDAEQDRLAKGAVLVSEATDPDLLQFLQLAGGVLTEQGGVSSHAALVCRELGIPTIIGIDGLLDSLKDGDVVEVDANTGEVRLMETSSAEPPLDLIYDDAALVDVEIIGAKGVNLLRARTLGARIPKTVFLNYERVLNLIEADDQSAADRLASWVSRQLNPGPRGLAIRSSAVGEDSTQESMAGMYHSIANVPVDGLLEGLRQFVTKNHDLGDKGYRGSILVQPMLEAAVGGVCLTADARLEHPNAVMIEAASDGAEGVTAGKVRPRRIVISREGADIISDTGSATQSDGGMLGGLPIRSLVEKFLRLEAGFGSPVDIEWTIDGEELHILQVRPIVGGSPLA